MALSLLSFFKRKPAKEAAVEAAPAPRPTVEKSSSERLSKTVMPNSTRTVSPQEPPFAGGFPLTPGSVSAGPTAPRTVAFGPSDPPRQTGMPPAVAVQLEPTVERAVALELSDIVGQMPPGWVRELKDDEPGRCVLLKAAELERGMSSGKPSVAIASIYDQVPEIFTRSIAPSETARVMLPFGKVLEQFAALHVRSDQRPEMAVPQVETPFLKLTQEDSERFGISADPLPLPTVRVEAATAEALAAAEPEALACEKITVASKNPPSPVRIPVPAAAPTPPASTAAPAPTEPAAPARIPFKLSPNGTGAPASERVPASSGPSVPTSLRASTPAAGAPARIPFKVAAPCEDIRPKAKGEPWVTKENFQFEPTPSVPAAPPPPAASGEVKIALALRPIFEGLAPFQLLGDANDVPADARAEFPFSLIEPQLVTGRVTLTPEQFAAALPDQYHHLFNPSDSAAVVSLPLQEVLKNLPATSLQIRQDQEEQEQGASFATPFSAKAEEDAKRFKVASTPIAKPVVQTAAPAPTPVKAPRVRPSAKAEAPKAERTELQVALDTDEELDPKGVVAHVGKMAGVKGCAILFGDGLSLAGNLPEEFNAEGLSAIAPSLMQRIENHMSETKLGSLRAMTLSCANAAVTFLTHNNLCLAALHAKEELALDVRDRLATTVQELSKTYSQPV